MNGGHFPQGLEGIGDHQLRQTHFRPRFADQGRDRTRRRGLRYKVVSIPALRFQTDEQIALLHLARIEGKTAHRHVQCPFPAAPTPFFQLLCLKFQNRLKVTERDLTQSE